MVVRLTHVLRNASETDRKWTHIGGKARLPREIAENNAPQGSTPEGRRAKISNTRKQAEA